MEGQEQEVFAYPARVLRGASSQTPDQLLALAKSKARNPEILTAANTYFFPAQISSDDLDSYFTRMSPSSLKNYGAEAAAGVSFQDSHNARRLPVGRSLSGEFTPAGEGGSVHAWFYIVRGLKFRDATYESSEDYINAIETGIVEDVSIGFYGGTYICSVCNVDMFDWSKGCPHWPGDSIETVDKDGAVTATEQVFAWVANAHLSEVSAVYAGATPGAVILRAQDLAARGRLKPEQIRLLEQRYRTRLTGAGVASDMSLEAHSLMVANSIGELIKRFRGRRDDRSQKDNRGLSPADVERLTAFRTAMQRGDVEAGELLKVVTFISKEESERLRRGGN